MPRKSKKKPSFFKVLINMESTEILRLPPAFMRKYELNLPEKVKIRVHSGRKWKVKLQKNGGGFCFTKGWAHFAEEASLKIGEFLVFTLNIAKSEFDVEIYDPSFCQREIPLTHGSRVKKKKRSRGRNDVVGIPGRGSSEKGNPLYFEIFLKKHHQSRISLPQEFARAANMKEKSHVRMVFLPTNRCENVVLDPRPAKYRTDLSKGWSEFRVANGLEYEKIYSFEFKPNEDAIHVKEVKKGE